MGRIFYLMGKSSSGKDTIYKSLLEQKDLKLRTIVCYTTRPIRAGETDGVEYYFTDEKKLDEFRRQKKLIEVRTYQTVYGEWHYLSVNDEQIDLKSNDYLVMGTLESYRKMREFYGNDKLIPIYIEVDDGIRLTRALNREKAQDVPKYAELCRRFLADEQDFTEEKIEEAAIKRRFLNEDFSKCLDEIIGYIKETVK